VFFIDRQRGWFCGIDATIGRTVDGGATWELLPTGIDFTLYTIHIAGGKGYSVGDKGAYLESPDGGLTWELKTDVIKSKLPFRDVCFSSPSMGWVVGKSGTVVRTADAGVSWEFLSGLSYTMDFFSMPKALEFGGGTE
ncbi:MAG: hypothetical protein GY850_17540, partial [bacterium]|nr:hypothetical protein [bacterium]